MTPKSALISCYDKSNLEDIANTLIKLDISIFASGKTYEYLRSKSIPATSIIDKFGIKPVLGGRVKTLHPLIFSGLLADRNNIEHCKYISDNNIQLYDILISNLYPFISAKTDKSLNQQALTELIDIGGVSLIRAAAKNFRHILVVTQPEDYHLIEDNLLTKSIDEGLRRKFAVKAFKHTFTYDMAIHDWLENPKLNSDEKLINSSSRLPEKINLNLNLILPLRYGENPHQKAGIYTSKTNDWDKWKSAIKYLNPNRKKVLSLNNLSDSEIGNRTIKYLKQPSCVIIKHGTPCGIAEGESQIDAWQKAYNSDPISAFGGIVVFNTELEAEVASKCRKKFIEVIQAPNFSYSAIEVLSDKATQLLVPPPQSNINKGCQLFPFGDGFIVQENLSKPSSISNWQLASKASVSESIKTDLEFAWIAIQQVRSNAVIIVANKQSIGIGTGFTNRIDATIYAINQANLHHKNNENNRVCASDAFFPFVDSIDELQKANIKAMVFPSGAKKQDELISSANRYGIALWLTNERQFRH